FQRELPSYRRPEMKERQGSPEPPRSSELHEPRNGEPKGMLQASTAAAGVSSAQYAKIETVAKAAGAGPDGLGRIPHAGFTDQVREAASGINYGPAPPPTPRLVPVSAPPQPRQRTLKAIVAQQGGQP